MNLVRHYKGGMYEILNIATHSETEEEMVIYKSLSNDKLWVRPYKMFTDFVEVDGKKKLRFTPIGE